MQNFFLSILNRKLKKEIHTCFKYHGILNVLKFNFGCGEQCLDIYLTMLGLEYQLVMYPPWQSITHLIIFLRGRLVVWGKAINPTCVQVKWTGNGGGLPDSLPSTTSELLVSYTDCAHETKSKKHQISTSSVGVKYNLKYIFFWGVSKFIKIFCCIQVLRKMAWLEVL